MAAGVQLERGLVHLMKAQWRIDAQKKQLAQIRAQHIRGAAGVPCALLRESQTCTDEPEGPEHARRVCKVDHTPHTAPHTASPSRYSVPLVLFHWLNESAPRLCQSVHLACV